MENNLENKARFIAQYYGVKALYVGGVGVVRIGYGGWNLKHPDFFLKLTPLSEISDEDRNKCISLGETHLRNFNQKQVDFLRSIGIALAFHDLSVEDLINYGWIKLKTNGSQPNPKQ